MVDNDIIKALKCCEIAYDQDCAECPLYPDDGEIACREVLREEALDLITRQQAEIERLKKDILIAKDAYTMLQTKNEIVKSESVKEFAKKVIKKVEKARQKYQRLCAEQGNKEDEAMNIHFREMINLVKEMVYM